MSKWIKKGDTVLVVSGNNRGRKGVVLRRKNEEVVVQGINIRKKHIKRQAQVQTPSIIDIEKPVHISNVRLCDNEGKLLKIKVKQSKKGKELVYSQGSKDVLFRSIRKD